MLPTDNDTHATLHKAYVITTIYQDTKLRSLQFLTKQSISCSQGRTGTWLFPNSN